MKTKKFLSNTKMRWLFNSLIALIITFSLLAGATGTAMAGKDDPLKADPRLLQLAEENPDAIFMVIVQKEAKGNDLEKEVRKGNGKVKKELDLIHSFSAEMTGKEILKLAKHPHTRWISADALMASTSAPGMETVLDRFEQQTYTGNDGSEMWADGWWEGGHNQPVIPHGGVFLVDYSNYCADGAGYCLRMDPYFVGSHVYRSADLSGATIATLSFYRNNQILADNGVVELQVSGDGGATWTTLQSYSSANLVGSGTDSFDITDYASSNTQIRFYVISSQNAFYYIYFDDIQIEYAVASAYVSAVQADQVGLTGDGVNVAVIDSGIAYHNDFDITDSKKSRIEMNEYFTDSGGSEDLYGHGTHVSGIIAGNGKESNGQYRGIATEAGLINLKVADKDGMMYESDVIEAMQWVYEKKDDYNIRVLNVSLNSTVAQSYHTSPLSAAVEVLWFNNIVVVVAAGNNGTGDGPVTLFPPANDPFVITVGAIEDKGTTDVGDDTLAVFSAYGTTEDGFAKPDIVAPGRNLVAALAEKASTVYTEHPLHRVDDYYFRMSGTSMAAPVVSGVIALILQENPSLNPDQIKYRLMYTASKNWTSYNADSAGAGTVNAYYAAYKATTSSANQGIMPSLMLASGEDGIDFASVGWNSVGWNSVGWNSVGWNSVGWNSVGWNSVGWNSVGWNSLTWDD